MKIFITLYTAITTNSLLVLMLEASAPVLFLFLSLYLLYFLYGYLFSPLSLLTAQTQLELSRRQRRLYASLMESPGFNSRLLLAGLKKAYDDLEKVYKRLYLNTEPDRELVVDEELIAQMYEELSLLHRQICREKGKQHFIAY